MQDAIGLLSHAVTVATELEWSGTPCARRLREARAEAQRLAKEFVAQKKAEAEAAAAGKESYTVY
eukprot:COSAG01_NODE_8774_length_2664_cov_2.312671_3_plen_65_part_00